jgi:hypothetical protein
MSGLHAFVVTGCGEADSPHPEMFDAKIRSTVRYADPSSWIVAAAVANAASESSPLWTDHRHEIGMIAVSDVGPRQSMEEVEALGVTGSSSPLRYAASSPGSLVGVSCIAFGFRGPTLNFTMAPVDGVSTALTICDAWMSRKKVPFIVMATYSLVAPLKPLARALLLAPVDHQGINKALTKETVEWITGTRLEEEVKA